MQPLNSFEHRHAAHCESGVVSGLLRHKGLDLSEPMVFGLTGAISFAYMPFVRFGNMPLIAYRMFPGHIIKTIPKRLGIKYHRRVYRDANLAMQELADLVDDDQVVGLQTSAYFTPYFPPEMRFQFNAHNTIVFGRENGEFLVSDPVFEGIQRIKAEDLKKARFARGFGAPKGLAHFPLEVPQTLDMEKLIKLAVRKTVKMMLYAPVWFIGIKGMHYLAGRIEALPRKHEPKYVRQFLGNVVRMQEEIGTGGGGFRFIYAAFLQEAYEITDIPVLAEASGMMTMAGDKWRNFALACARVVKRREDAPDAAQISQLLHECAETEKDVYAILKTL